jgi:hypothetical protein
MMQSVPPPIAFREVEGANAFQFVRTLQDFGMAQRTNGVIVMVRRENS